MSVNQSIIVWTMGKVGSKSINATLEAHGFEPVHVHRLAWPRFLELRKGGRPLLINLVRDPFARNLSAYFQNLDEWLPAWRNASGQRAANHFSKKYNHLTPTHWFEDHFHRRADLDTYATFDKQAGFGWADGKRTRCLTMRSSLPDSTKAQLLSILFDKPIDKIVKSNVASDKESGQLYADAKRAVFPKEVVDQAYDQPFTRNFWTDEEIEAMRAKWTTR